MITNNIEYVLTEMGKPVNRPNTDVTLAQFVTMGTIENAVTTVTPKLICSVMDAMVWPKMGKTQFAVNTKVLRHYNAVVRHFKKDEITNRTETEAKEVVSIVLRRRGFT